MLTFVGKDQRNIFDTYLISEGHAVYGERIAGSSKAEVTSGRGGVTKAQPFGDTIRVGSSLIGRVAQGHRRIDSKDGGEIEGEQGEHDHLGQERRWY